jgi:uncharacterized protein (DUF2164 family)
MNKIRGDNENTINLKVMTKGGEIKIENVVEYVCGKLFFYINLGIQEGVKVIDRKVIIKVIRFNSISEWPVNLKQFKD